MSSGSSSQKNCNFMVVTVHVMACNPKKSLEPLGFVSCVDCCVSFQLLIIFRKGLETQFPILMLTNEITFDYKWTGIFGCSEFFHFSFPYNGQLQWSSVNVSVVLAIRSSDTSGIIPYCSGLNKFFIFHRTIES